MKLLMIITAVIILVVATLVLFRKHSVKTNNASTITEKKFVIYQGARMVEGWPEQIEKAQTKTKYWSSRFDWTVIPVLSGQGFRF